MKLSVNAVNFAILSSFLSLVASRFSLSLMGFLAFNVFVGDVFFEVTAMICSLVGVG